MLAILLFIECFAHSTPDGSQLETNTCLLAGKLTEETLNANHIIAIGVGYWSRTCTIKAHVWNSCTLGIKLWTIVINLKQINSFNAGQQVVSACTHPRSMGAGGLAGERMERTRTNNTTSDKMWAKTTIYNSERGKLKHKTRVRARLFNKPNCGACGLKEGLLGIRSTSRRSEIINAH